MSKYEVKLVNIGEEVDNRIRELEIEVKDIRKANDNLTRANESYRQENIEMRKENFGVEVAMLTKKVDDLTERNTFLEKLHSQHRYVFSEIPNTEENMKMVKLMKKHINPNKYTLRWRGQYLIGGEDWRKYQDGQPMNKSKCIRVYIDNKGSTETTEGFNLQEVGLILDGLYCTEDQCHEFLGCWDYKGNEKDEDVVNEKATLKQILSLQKYFEEMKVHLEECQSNMAETNEETNDVT